MALLPRRNVEKSGSECEWRHQGERVTVRNNIWFGQYIQEDCDAVKFYGMSEENADEHSSVFVGKDNMAG